MKTEHVINRLKKEMLNHIGFENAIEKYKLVKKLTPDWHRYSIFEQHWIVMILQRSLSYLRTHTQYFVVGTRYEGKVYYFIPTKMTDLKHYRAAIKLIKQKMDETYRKGVQFVKNKGYLKLRRIEIMR